ncbi:MAG: putative deacylase [Candidatus Aldehydirespiratoraceae bacterium]|jgi:predicted deacylase
MPMRAPFLINGQEAKSGRRTQIEIPIARLMSGTPVALPVIVLHGASDGPTVWINAAIHGDEIGGVEIVRRVLESIDAKTLNGTLIAVPIVNVHGFNTGDRYFPDRRDLNRSFPGSARGSLASQVAFLMMSEIVRRCDIGIDLHTGSDHRSNLPQIRADLDDPTTLELAQVFGAPVSIHARTRDGSLRHAATEAGATVLLYEAGEALRFDKAAIEMGTQGVLRVLSHLQMVSHQPSPAAPTQLSRSTRWLRATRSGIVQMSAGLGDAISAGDDIAIIRDPFGKQLGKVRAPSDGIVIGCTDHPLVNRGDAIIHIANVEPVPE